MYGAMHRPLRRRLLTAAAALSSTALSTTSLSTILATWLALPLPLQAAGKAHTVRIEGMKFVPDRLEVAVGDRVEWINNDLVPHTVTAAAASIESGSIAPEARWRWTARRAGEVRYVCRFHPGMQAVLTVK